MDQNIAKKEASVSPSLATMMAMEMKGKQHSGMPSSSRNASALAASSAGNPSSNSNNGSRNTDVGGNYQNHYSHHHLHHLDGPPTLHRRNSGSSNASSVKSKGKQGNNSKRIPSTSTTEQNGTVANKMSSKKAPKKSKNPLRVLGIALIVDQKGTGARMLARYPTSQASVKIDEDEDHENGLFSDPHRNGYDELEDDEGNGDDRRRGRGDDDLFFTLTARQMAKLFRTKRSLCNQPMTLRVNKTIFCCHAVLLEEANLGTNDNNSEKDKSNGLITRSGSFSASSSVASDDNDIEDKEDNSLRLFSIVVALAPSSQQSALPFSSFWDVGGFGGGEDRSDLERYIRHGGKKSPSKSHEGGESADKNTTSKKKADRKSPNDDKGGTKTSKQKQKKKQTAARVSSVFLAIRRVHISLVRFCRALEREEHRCGYITHQSRALFQIRNERQKQLDLLRNRNPHQALATAMTSLTNNNNSSGGGDRSPYPERPRHSRQNSFISTPGGGNTLLSDTSLKKAFENIGMSGDAISSVEQEQEKEQEILELMLACNPQNNSPGQQDPYEKRQHGNLVRDLVAVFHSLSRNDHEYPPTPSSLLCERDAVVYVNQHFAIPIDAAGLSGHSQSSSFTQGTPLSQQHKIGSVPIAEGGLPVVRPYYTLLFPHASPSELLQTFHSSGSAPPQQMEHLLLTVNPQKPLTQIAADANLPMHTTMQIASFLIAHGACTTSPVVSSRSRLTCFGSDSMQRIPELALDFSQSFPGVSLFGVVSFLTTSCRQLGDTMAILANTENEEGAWLRESLLASPKYGYHNHNRGGGDGDKVGPTETAVVDPSIAKSTHQAHFPDEKNESSYSPTIHPKYITASRGGGHKPPEPTPMSAQELEELLFSIAVWLLSHKVLVQLQEYMVAVAEASSPSLIGINGGGADNDSSSSVMMSPPSSVTENARGSTITSSVAAVSSNAAVKSSNNDWEENLFKELLEMDYLNGDISVMALSWRIAMDPRKLRRWGLRHKRVRIISRIPSPGDDWEPETTATPSPLSPLEEPRSSSPPGTTKSLL